MIEQVWVRLPKQLNALIEEGQYELAFYRRSDRIAPCVVKLVTANGSAFPAITIHAGSFEDAVVRMDAACIERGIKAIPRRNQLEKLTTEELKIREVRIAIEALGCHPILTNVATGLEQMQNLLADWHDEGRPGEFIKSMRKRDEEKS